VGGGRVWRGEVLRRWGGRCGVGGGSDRMGGEGGGLSVGMVRDKSE
jgi:hypothetical protein